MSMKRSTRARTDRRSRRSRPRCSHANGAGLHRSAPFHFRQPRRLRAKIAALYLHAQSRDMKIAVIGTGAMGSVYVALLGAAGHDVWAIDSWPEHIEAIRKDGLRLEGASGDRTVKVHASTRAADAGVCDLIIIATKAMHVAQAAEAAKAIVGPNTMVLSIQNGLGGPDTAASVLGRERVMVGVVGGFGASMKGPGHAHHNGWELVRLGELTGPITPRLEQVAQVWA